MPPEGLNVEITLSNGVKLMAYRDANNQWWAGLPDNPDDVPIAAEHVVSWEYLP